MRYDIDWRQIDLAVNSGLLSYKDFDITPELIEKVAYLKLHDINEFKNKKLSKQTSLWNLYCRTAALNLLKFKDNFDITKNYNQAFIYIMVDKRHPNLYKIGRSIEPDVRAATANTFSPYKTYEILSFRYSQNAINLERYFHDKYKDNSEGGELFFFHDILTVIQDLNNHCTNFKLPI